MSQDQIIAEADFEDEIPTTGSKSLLKSPWILGFLAIGVTAGIAYGLMSTGKDKIVTSPETPLNAAVQVATPHSDEKANDSQIAIQAKAPASQANAQSQIRPVSSEPLVLRFGFDTAELDVEQEARLAAWSADLTTRKLAGSIDGYTDGIGSEAYNKDLSVRRARAVASALEKHGITLENVQTRGHGASNPIETNASALGRSANRRVMVQLVDTSSSETH